MNTNFHVSVNGSDSNTGTAQNPFRTISKAAGVAKPGDTITVHAGTYREWVKPALGGTSNVSRITYEAAEGEKVIIKGSEQVKNWELLTSSVWKAVLPNTMFGSYNPYAEELTGDWFVYPSDWKLHAGDVYLNGKSFYEARTLDDVKNPVKRTEGENPPWTKRTELLLNPEDSVYQWYAEVGEEFTTIYANFHGKNPNEELTEVNVRKCCFYPEKTGRNFITVRGFEMAHAASNWAPPTADQPGLLGANWSRGWIIENNIIHDAKCSAISIGKEESTGHNDSENTLRKPGYQFQMEAVFKARKIGWSKEKIGSHIIRNNTIYDCGQNGIVGHMGCVFSEIYGNQIYNIAVKHEYFGYEIAGIKLHAAIDVQIYGNNIHNTTLGVWLDWQAQGTRVSKNLFYANDRDLFVEVTHGPHLVDGNIFASEYNFDNIAQGGAFINNLCCGTMRREPVLNRATPYHFPHSTEVAGTTFVYGGDDRWYNNIFVGGAKTYTEQSTSGTESYNGSPANLDEYIERVKENNRYGDLNRFERVADPAYINGNVYLNGAPAAEHEKNNFKSVKNPGVSIITEDNATYILFEAEKAMLNFNSAILESADLGTTRISEAAYENPDGKSIIFDTDFNGAKRDGNSPAGPFAKLTEGVNKIKVWG
ncbi:MAG: DUF1565 domain-containing protein [Clostridiales bacterium]|nr:DUF1565 domain-containing protein [Clostridiales bacterium]